MQYFVTVDQKDIKKERNKAKELRKSPWWKQRIASGVCHYCEQVFKPNELSMVPVARGGKSSKGNVVPSCKDCNNNKTYKTPAELILENMDI